MNRAQFIAGLLAGLCGVVVAAVLPLEDGTALDRPGLTAAGAHVVILATAAVCLTAAARTYRTCCSVARKTPARVTATPSARRRPRRSCRNSAPPAMANTGALAVISMVSTGPISAIST